MNKCTFTVEKGYISVYSVGQEKKVPGEDIRGSKRRQWGSPQGVINGMRKDSRNDRRWSQKKNCKFSGRGSRTFLFLTYLVNECLDSVTDTVADMY